MARLFGRSRAREAEPAPPTDEITPLRDALRALVRRVNASAGRLPVGAVPDIRDITDQLDRLLDHAQRNPGAVDTYALMTLSATIGDYLPTSIDRFLALPHDFVTTHRNNDGETPEEELLSHLVLLNQGVGELATAIFSGDAQRLESQGRFLDTKFARSDLDL